MSDCIKIFIVQCDDESCADMRSFFELVPEFECCGEAHDGKKAIEDILKIQPDVVVLDMVLPIMDGYEVLEQIRASDIPNQPEIVFTSANGHEVVVCRAYDLGASYFLVKPYSLIALQDRINMLVEDKKDTQLNNTTSKMVAKYVISLGVPTHILAYTYTARAVVILISQNGPCAIGKKVYTVIANENNTNIDCIERSVRFGVEEAKRKRTPEFEKLMRFGEIKSGENITTSEFLKLTAEYIKLHDDF